MNGLVRRNARAERIENRKVVENTVRTTPNLDKNQLRQLATVFLKKTKRMKKRHIRKYLADAESK